MKQLHIKYLEEMIKEDTTELSDKAKHELGRGWDMDDKTVAYTLAMYMFNEHKDNQNNQPPCVLGH